jgi:hypothetical protein
MTADPKANAVLVDALGSALRRGGHALGSVPDLLKRVLDEQSWREFVTQRGEHVEHERFVDFVTTPPLKGLGADVALVKRLVADDPEALDLLDQALQNPDALHNVQANAPTGNAKDRALRKLRKDAPELHAEVLAGRLSAHAAMVQAGYRPHTFTVRPDPSSAVRSLRKYMTPDQLAELARLLTEET